MKNLEKLAYDIQCDFILELNCWPTIQSWDYGLVGPKLSENEYSECLKKIHIWHLRRGKYYIKLLFDDIGLEYMRRNRQPLTVNPILIFNSMNPWLTKHDINKIKRDMRDTIRYVNELTVDYNREFKSCG